MYENIKLIGVVTLLFKILLNYLFLELAVNTFDLYYLNYLETNGIVTSELETYWRIKSNIISYSTYYLPIFVGLFFIAWMYREYKIIQNVFHQNTFKYKPIAAVFAFIIPIFNLWGPYIIMNEIVNGNEVYHTNKISYNYIKFWWIGYVIYLIYGRIISLQKPILSSEFITYTYHLIFINIIGLISLTYLILLLKQLKPTLIKTEYK